MKNFLKIAVAAMAILCTTATFAQGSKNNQPKQKLTPEQIATTQAQEIAYSLGLDDATTAKFVTTFVNYRMDIRAAKKSAGTKKIKKDMNEQQVEDALKAQFAHSKKVLDIREKYFGEYRKFLNPRQIQRVYELEKRQTEKMKAQQKERKANKKANKKKKNNK
ncbi:MAG: hypothetical protein J6U53_03580 [Tidjanibacter sp.]|nr:hypothetical protein [Tidjanibacter sp.]